MRAVRLIACVAVALIGLTGCADRSSAPAAEATSQPRPSGNAAMHVGTTTADPSVIKLRDLAIAAGYPCPQWRARTVFNAKGAGRCSPIETFATFATHADTMAAVHLGLEAEREVTPRGVFTPYHLVGKTWVISDLDGRRLRHLRQALGGRIYHTDRG